MLPEGVMDRAIVYARTSLGNDALLNPSGKITGDEKRLMLLIDGSACVAEIINKIPPSVQAQLEAALDRLLSAQFIKEAGRVMPDVAPHEAAKDAKGEDMQSIPARPDTLSKKAGLAALDAGRCLQLEKELAGVREQLAARVTQLKDASVRYEKSRQKIIAHAQGMQAKLTEKMRAIAAGSLAEKDLRANYDRMLREYSDSVTKLNQVLIEQQDNVEITLKMNAFNPAHNAVQHKDLESEMARLVRTHPHFNSLVGLDFFKAFGNTELLHFLKIANFQDVRAGETVLHEGDVGLSFFIIASGSLGVFKQGNLLASLEKGEFFGEFSHLSGEQPLRSSEVVAVTDCELFEIEPLDIEFSSVQLRLNVAEAFLRGMVKRSFHSNQRIGGLLGNKYTPNPETK